MTTSINPNIEMKKYVGTEKIAPDSRMPRRLPKAMTAIATSPNATRWASRLGNADVIASTPAAMDTATVSV